MDKTKFRLIAGLLISLSLLNTCRCQQSAIFNPSPFQRRQQTQQLRQFQQQQQQQRQQAFPNALGALNPLNAISPISPIVPQSAYRNYNQLNSQNFVPITAYQNEINYDGSFAYGYSAGDGTTAQAQGYVKNLGLGEAVEAQVVEGSYSYTSPEGTPITVRYIADENGFRAEGAHIPTPPPIPEAIAKSLQYASSLQPYQQQGLNPNLNPFQTPYRQFPTQPTTLLRPGQQQLSPLQLQQQQQQQRIYQQQNSGQYQPENQFGQQQRGQFQGSQLGVGGGGGFGQFGQPQNFQQQQQTNQKNFTQQQQNLQNLQQQQSVQQQQQKQQQEQQQDAQQQQLATQELRGRPSQLVNPFGYNQYRRYKKATKK